MSSQRRDVRARPRTPPATRPKPVRSGPAYLRSPPEPDSQGGVQYASLLPISSAAGPLLKPQPRTISPSQVRPKQQILPVPNSETSSQQQKASENNPVNKTTKKTGISLHDVVYIATDWWSQS